MKYYLFYLIFLIYLINFSLIAIECDENDRLVQDMMTVEYWNHRINERLPITFNNLLQGGYINMPSARMGDEGEIGIGYSFVPPYRNYNLRLQLIDRLEVSGNYRIFRGVDDPILTPLGFGDLADKGANVKIAILLPEESGYTLPGVSIGFEDIIGTRSFKSQYLVLTQVLLKLNLEASLGYGGGRIRGFFGGVIWMPFRHRNSPYFKNLALVAEYDAIPYKDPSIEKHPKGRLKKSPFNFGLKFRLFDALDFSMSYIRGNAFAWAVSTYYNFGYTKGILPKVDDPLPYRAPINTEPLGPRRPEDAMTMDLLYAFRDQGFDLLLASLSFDECENKTLRLQVYNFTYRTECEVRMRLNYLLAYLIPDDIDTVVVVIEDEGFPIQEYRYDMEYVRQFGDKCLCDYELRVLTPLREVSCLPNCSWQLFKQHLDWWNIQLLPRTQTFFGSSRGKFKYSLGLTLCFNGYLWQNIYYSFRLRKVAPSMPTAQQEFTG